MKYENLMVCSLTSEQHERTCNYWYTVTSFGMTPHTAFTRRQALDAWLAERGLSLATDLPAHGEHGVSSVVGSYRQKMHGSYDEFFALDGLETKTLSNGDYTLAIITDDADGLKTVHTLMFTTRASRLRRSPAHADRDPHAIP